jgi:hypothetical protein
MRTIAVPLKLINLNDDGFHLLVEIVVFGSKYFAVIDTGASRSVFDKHFIEDNKTQTLPRCSLHLLPYKLFFRN